MIVRSSLIVPVLLPILEKVIFALKGICPHGHAPLDAYENVCAARDKNNRVLFYQVLNLFTSRPQTTRIKTSNQWNKCKANSGHKSYNVLIPIEVAVMLTFILILGP